MTERDPRPSLQNRKKTGRGGEEEESLAFSVSSPPPLPVISLRVVVDNRARRAAPRALPIGEDLLGRGPTPGRPGRYFRARGDRGTDFVPPNSQGPYAQRGR